MIKYALGCAEGHAFESWFPDSAAYEKQRKRGLGRLPRMRLDSTSTRRSWRRPSSAASARRANRGPEIVVDDRRRQAREFLTRMRREIEANTDDVGSKFPQVARAIHLGEEPERAIRGRASLEEARSLVEDGVGVFPLPMLEDELN